MRRALAAVLLLCLALPAFAQSMRAHYPDRTVLLDLTDLDSLTYSGETMGIPASVELSVNFDGEDAGGAVWELSVAALVRDGDGQPVEDGKTVIFSLDSDDVYIGDGETGNPSIFGQTAPGVAFTSLMYHSGQTNETVRVYVSCAAEEGIAQDSLEVILPPLEPVGVLSVSPSNHHFEENDEYAVFELTVYAYDGHQHLIPGAEVHFSPQFGRIYETDTVPPTGEQSYTAVLDEDGQTTRYLILTRYEAFPDPTVSETTVTLNAEIRGHGWSSIESFTFTLYQNGGLRESGDMSNR
ncbi:hypothetical protein KQI63_11770 [bacterium]|nr:hypothetical protein [bacterium]